MISLVEYQAGLTYSEEVAKLLKNLLNDNDIEYDVYIQTFYSRDEQGYLFLMNSYDGAFISLAPAAWICSNNKTNKLYAVISDETHIICTNNMYDDFAMNTKHEYSSTREAANMIAEYFTEIGRNRR